VGTCEMRRSWGGVSCGMKPQDGGAVEAQGIGWPLEKMSCLVPLRTGMSREPDHRTLPTHHSLLTGQGTVTRPTRTVPLLLGWKWIV
jgi:hypothetical protein